VRKSRRDRSTRKWVWGLVEVEGRKEM